MKRGILFIILIVLMAYYFIPSATSVWQNNNEGRDGVVYETFVNSGVLIQEINVNGWSLIENKALSIKEQKRYLSKIINKISIHNTKIKERDDRNYKGLQYTGWINDKIYLSIVCQSVNTKDTSTKGETYLMVSMKDKYSIKEKNKMLEVRDKIFKATNTKGNYSSYLVGRLKPESDSQKIQQNILSKLKAVKVQQIKEGNLTSVTAYSPLISDKINIGNDVINLNLAIRKNSSTMERYIYLGTPIITGEY